jgi:hypothetical protein
LDKQACLAFNSEFTFSVLPERLRRRRERRREGRRKRGREVSNPFLVCRLTPNISAGEGGPRFERPTRMGEENHTFSQALQICKKKNVENKSKRK